MRMRDDSCFQDDQADFDLHTECNEVKVQFVATINIISIIKNNNVRFLCNNMNVLTNKMTISIHLKKT